jgi:myo-inositol-1(or 4)-monophosphatase
MATPVATRHRLACALAREAGAHALSLFRARDQLIIEAKANPQDVVSRADREVEALVRSKIMAAFPDDAIRGEEDAPKHGTSGFTWVIDPIDGTMPFLSGLQHWCVAIALVEGGQTVAAATFAPVHGDLFDAVRGGGFRVNDTAHTLPDTLTLTNAMTAIGASHRTPPAEIADVIHRLLVAGGAYYRNGSGALMLAEVAVGRLAGYFEPHMNAWDCIGGLLMVDEAGGRTAPFKMDEMLAIGGPVLAAAPAAYDALVEICDTTA